MNPLILQEEVQNYLNVHLDDDVNRILLGKSPFAGISPRELAQQLESRKKCEKKLPTWFARKGIYYPPKISIEQTSSELTARYKSTLALGDRLIDLTGGLGVDSYYFSKRLKDVVHCELNSELSTIASHNASVLNQTNIEFLNTNGLEYLSKSDVNFDTIFVDPSRRVESKKVFLLQDTEPNVVSNLPLLLGKAKRVIIKTSPLFDIHSGLQELSSVKEIHVVSVKNDCKELLWVIDAGFEGEPNIVCAALTESNSLFYTFEPAQEKSLRIERFYNPLSFLYEPDVAILKAGAFKSIATCFHLGKLNRNTHLYTSERIVENFVGRVFKIRSVNTLKTFKASGIRKANVITRNFPLQVEEIKKKYKIQDGGDLYLIFCTGAENQLLAIEAERVNS
ncbi:hypothetical protein [Pedobacter sp. SYSU D00535]|uniref:THUMP-like domain-containing protein n=1 Tax=Pedobacter sp. SYSU D00535 TaxID=2810308 RepID=UPI001A961B0E|nr:hypothetical protein [Pedobacter sp. SYSU D00535]